MRRLQALSRKGFSWPRRDDDGWFQPTPSLSLSTTSADREALATDFESYVQRLYKENGVAFACIGVRARIFSEARFQFQRINKGRPGDLWGNESLSLLENPWANGTTGELLFRMEQDASLAGNFFGAKTSDGRRIRRLRPDWVTIVTGSPSDDPFDIDAEVAGYIYRPPGRDPVLLSVDRVVHFTPVPDPDAQWRGMSWLTPVLRELQGDSAATDHKLKYFKQGTTGALVVTYDASLGRDEFLLFKDAFDEAHAGGRNAYKTIHLGGGADVKSVGADLRQLDFKSVQGAGETRIAAASGVGAVVGMLSEGMQGSSLNAGNYNAAKRQVADTTIRPLWRMAAASLSKFVNPPPDSRLWYDDRDISFLHDDAKDEAEILQTQMNAIEAGIRAGFDAGSVVAAVSAGDLTLMKHSGLVSVQLQEPGALDGAVPAPVPAGEE